MTDGADQNATEVPQKLAEGTLEDVLLSLSSELLRVFPANAVDISRLAQACGFALGDTWQAVLELMRRGLVVAFDAGPGRSLYNSAQLTKDGKEAASRLGVIAPLGAVEEFAAGLEDMSRTVLEAAVEHELRGEGGGAATRSHLRTSLRKTTSPKPDVETANRTIDGLVRNHLQVIGGAEPSYQITLMGLLASRWGLNALALIESTIPLLREFKDKDPSLFRYAWADVRRAAGVPRKAVNLAHLALTHSKLAVVMLDTEGDKWWTAPKDLDVLLDCNSGFDYLRETVTLQQDQPKMAASSDPKKVFIIHGRNLDARKQMGIFVRSLGLEPINFGDLRATMGGTPTIADIVDRGMSVARGVIALFTPDEFAALQPQFRQPQERPDEIARWQARPNVIFEAGMAFGRDRTRVVFVLFGNPALFTDVAGIHVLRPTNDPMSDRALLRSTLAQGMQCAVDGHSTEWMDAGDFETCVAQLSGVSARDPFAEPESNDVAAPSDSDLYLNTGRVSPYFTLGPDPDACVLEDCYVLLCARRVSSMADLLPILEQLAKEKGSLLLVATSVEGEALATLIRNLQLGVIRVCAVQTASMPESAAILRRIAKATGATIFGDEAGVPLGWATLSKLGRAKRVVSSDHSTLIVQDASKTVASSA